MSEHLTVTGRPPSNDPGVTLSVPAIAGLYLVLASPDSADAVLRQLGRLEKAEGVAARPVSPDEWFLLAPDDAAAARLAHRLAAGLGDHASVLDQSDGRVLITAEGPDVREMLAKGTGMDLDPAVFDDGRSATTAFGHVTIHITRTGPDRYDLIVMRSFAESLWKSLHAAAREFGCTAPAEFIEQV